MAVDMCIIGGYGVEAERTRSIPGLERENGGEKSRRCPDGWSSKRMENDYCTVLWTVSV